MARKLTLLLLLVLVATAAWFSTPPDPPAVLARVEAAGIVSENKIPFKVRLLNQGEETVTGLSVTANASQHRQRFELPSLEPGEEKTVELELAVGEGEGPLDFTAIVEGEAYSYQPPKAKVARSEGVGGGRALLYSQVQQIQITSPQQMGTSPMDLPSLALNER